MAQFGSFDIMDYSKEQSGFSFGTGAVTVTSIAGLLTQFGALRTALEGIILGTVVNESQYAWNTRLSNTPPADENAQVERGWYVSYEDVTAFFDELDAIPNAGFGKKFGFTIPTADVEGRLRAESDFADLTDTQIAAFITAFEAIARSPYGGMTNVLSIKSVGRNR